MASLGMILLPLLYIGMIVAVGWGLWQFAEAGPPVSTGRRKGSGTLFTYVAPLVIGAIVVLFMIKPLFSRRPKAAEPRALRRDAEPRLFAFIEQICDLVGAPRPKRVLVDLNVNASASLAHGAWSLFSRNLTLTIGLPLAGGLTAREFGGVLAHEFGHFAQGAGMKTTYVVRMVSFWFARVVYERDLLDAALEGWAKGIDIRFGIVLHAARLMVWCVRRILWVLMWVGQLISSVLMRQMEFDADHYEIQSAGSDSFISTAKRLRALGLGAHITHSKQEEAFTAKRLVDDLPGWMLHETAQIPADTVAEVEKAALAEKTGWFDTHPSDAERIARAEAAHSEGVLKSDAPASALFTDFQALSREITGNYYKDVLELAPGSVALQSLSKMTSESDEAKRGDEASEKYFDGVLGAAAMVFLSPEDVAHGPSAEEWRTRNQTERKAATEGEKSAAKQLHESFQREHDLIRVGALDEAKISWRAEDLKLSSKKEVTAEFVATRAKLNEANKTLAPLLSRSRARLASAIGSYLNSNAHSDDEKAEVRRCIATLNFFEGINQSLQNVLLHTTPLGAILNNMERSSKQEAVYEAVKRHSDDLNASVNAVLERAKAVAYPLPHSRGSVTMWEYLTDGVAHGDPMILTFLRGTAILDRVYAIYRRIIGRLSVLALAEEAQMDLPSTVAI